MRKLLFFILLFFVFINGKVFSEDIATLHSSQGSVEAKSLESSAWTKASIHDTFQPHDAVRTGENSRAGLLFFNGVLVRLNEDSILEFKASSKESDSLPLRIPSGKAYFFSREPKQFPEIETPVVSAAVRGTEFVIDVDEDKTIISVMDGEVECRNEQGSVKIKGGEQAITQEGQAPIKQILIQPLDTVQWALYYPSILIDPSANIHALSLLEAAQYLSVGQVKKAQASLAKAKEELSFQSAKSQELAAYYSLESIIALIQNQKKEALDFARKGVEVAPDSASACLAMSYGEQAYFNLNQAQHWIEKVIRLAPQSGLAWARLAELELGFGKINQATRTIEKALNIAPKDVRVLTVAGFVHLTRYDTKKAIHYFDQAIVLESWNGLPHLGRGLAWIRKNKLEEGLREIEIAVHLEPSVSLYRSYLGKTFFEEKRDPLASHEYNMAKNLDPLDPTPYLYDAFNKLAHTRPVEALWDIEDSIRLNDHRAVYRSRMLLDQDQAVRSAGLSQAFTSVGFSEAARIEAVKSMNRDYSNYSAHLLLAGSYINTPRLGLASISELLITRLLVPLSFNPVDPSIRGEASFNEYASLFDRQRSRLFLDGSVRSADDFISGRVMNTLLTERSSYILSYFPEYTRGVSEGDWQRSNSVLFFTQMQPTYSDTLGFETIFGRNDEKDFELDNITHRTGFHHRFGPEAHFISQFFYTNREATLQSLQTRSLTLNTFQAGQLTASLSDSFVSDQVQNQGFKALRADGQFIWDSSWISIVAGGGAFDSNTHNDEIGRAPFDSLGLLDNIALSTSSDLSERSQRLYTYTTWHLSSWLDAFAAANFSRLELAQSIPPPFIEDTQIVDELDPKVGLAFYITPNTTLRTAYFETLGPVSITDLESIEPTQIAGFNQLVDEIPGNKARSYGVGVDQKFSKRTYFGAEALHRNVEQSLGFSSSIINVDTLTGAVSAEEEAVEFSHIETKENLLNAYFYQILTSQLTGTLDYTVAHLEDEFSVQESKTHRIRPGLNYFHPKGWFVRTSATWRNQDLEGFGSTDGIRDFWIWDASIGYQFPKRYGVALLSVTNILDQDFVYEPIGLDAQFLQDRSVNFRISLNF